MRSMDVYYNVDEHTISQLMLVNTNHTTQFDIPKEQNMKMSSFLVYLFPKFYLVNIYKKTLILSESIQCYITLAADTAR